MERDYGEFNEEELDSVLGGLAHAPAEEKALENSDNYRKKMIDELKREKEKIEQANMELESNGRGRR